MKQRWLPSAPEISRETLAVLAGAVLAGLVIQHWPAFKAWLRENGVLPTTGQ